MPNTRTAARRRRHECNEKPTLRDTIMALTDAPEFLVDLAGRIDTLAMGGWPVTLDPPHAQKQAQVLLLISDALMEIVSEVCPLHAIT